MAKDAQGHGSDSGSGGGFMRAAVQYFSGAMHHTGERDAAAQELSGGHPKSDPVPMHGGMTSSYPRNPGARYYSVL